MAEIITDVTDKKLYIRFPQRVPPEEEVKELSPYIVRVSYPRQKSARFCHIVLESQSVVPEVLKQLNNKEYGYGHLIVEMSKKLNFMKNEQESYSHGEKTFSKNKIRSKLKANKLSAGDGNRTVPQTAADESTHITAGKHVRRRSGKPSIGGDNDRRLWITKLPFKTEDKEVVAAFPGCIWAKVYRSKGSKSSRAICKFTTAQQAAAFAADPSKHRFKGKEVVIEVAKSQQLRGSGMKKKYGLKSENSAKDVEAESKVENETAVELKESENNCEESMDTEEEEDGDNMLESGDDTGDLDVNNTDNDD